MESKIAEKVNSSTNYSVKKLEDYSKKTLLSLFKSCSNQLNPIYGPQKNSALKLLNKQDRNSYILELNDKPIGILVYKKSLLHEDFAIPINYGYLEIKSFFLFDHFGEGHIWKLWDLLLSEIQTNYKDIDGIYVSVSKNKANASLNMFKQMGFFPLYETYNKYLTDGDSEVFLFCPLGTKLLSHYRDLTIIEPYFSQIKDGTKLVEGRSGKSFDHYKVGDVITFQNKGRKVQKQIKNVIKYSSLEEYLDNEGVENCLPGVHTKEEAIKIYHSIPGYLEKIQKYGIIAFRF